VGHFGVLFVSQKGSITKIPPMKKPTLMNTKLTIGISIVMQLLFAGLKSAAQVKPITKEITHKSCITTVTKKIFAIEIRPNEPNELFLPELIIRRFLT